MDYHWTIWISPIAGMAGLVLGHRLGVRRDRARYYNEVIGPFRSQVIRMIDSGAIRCSGASLPCEAERLQAQLQPGDWKRLQPQLQRCIELGIKTGHTDEWGQPIATEQDRNRLRSELEELLKIANIR
ncbi:MAG: hypothetical protein ACQEUG_16075 [Pseudomonadota bacterium]